MEVNLGEVCISLADGVALLTGVSGVKLRVHPHFLVLQEYVHVPRGVAGEHKAHWVAGY